MNYKKPFITPGTDWKVYSAGMRELLGMGRTEKLPEVGLPPRQVQGITVWVAPFVPKTGVNRWSGKTVRVKSSKHRVRALCPVCQKEFSAGRLFQHMPIHHDEA